ncbi:ATP-grasp fold amidoligase family protein [Neobacillus sp. KR4-4]|uniref:ATP-grasp fold amidoligase family protein n=1 Tax=Neobacillus sp. KR4-4 TaxID=3344872 RepID=UPI0035C96D86
MNDAMRKIMDDVQWMLPRKMAHSIVHFRFNKKLMPWKNPKTYDEKLRWLLANCYGKNESMYADKYEVRDYVKSCGLEEILIPCYGVWNSSDEIDVSKLPESFILKATHGTGSDCYAIVKDKSDTIALNAAFKKMDAALKINIAKIGCQYQYAHIKPRIICEGLLHNGGKPMTDYKVVCINGKPEYILVCSDRDEGRDYFDVNWNHLDDFIKPEFMCKHAVKKPENLEKMLKCAEVLSKPFAVVRIDFYNVGGCVYFGEITLTPSTCYHGNLTYKAEMEIGNKIKLPNLV